MSKRVLLQQERLEAIRRMPELVKNTEAAFVLVAGDLFDSSHATKATVSAACSDIGSTGVPVSPFRATTTMAAPAASGSRSFSGVNRHNSRRISTC